MSSYFVDTSALAKRYIVETGSNWVRGWTSRKSSNSIIISRLATVEIISILTRKQREGSLTVVDVARVRNNFFAHVRDQYTVVEIEKRVLASARDLLTKYPLRTLDALQLASALQASRTFTYRPTFVTADTRLLTAAAAEGLPVDNPTTHP